MANPSESLPILKLRDFKERQEIDFATAKRIFSATVLEAGGGWGTIQGVPVYGHPIRWDKTKKESVWQIHSFGGLK